MINNFLYENKYNDKINVRESENFNRLRESFHADKFPKGAFPAPYSLMFSQQFAVNEIFKRFSATENTGFYAVNGPPGTGKSTLLKDIMAGIFTQRAIELLKLKAGEVFQKIENKNIYRIHDSLKGFEMVVASSNNVAVENISLEVPDIKSIGENF